MMALYKVGVVLLAFLATTTALQCYSCERENRNVHIKDLKHLPCYGNVSSVERANCPGSACLKFIAEYQGYSKIQRTCSDKVITCEILETLARAIDSNIHTECGTCTDDLCNSSATSVPNYLLLLLPYICLKFFNLV